MWGDAGGCPPRLGLLIRPSNQWDPKGPHPALGVGGRPTSLRGRMSELGEYQSAVSISPGRLLWRFPFSGEETGLGKRVTQVPA